MQNSISKPSAYPLPFIRHLDVISPAIDKGDDELLIDIVNLVYKHITLRLYIENEEEFEQLFKLLKESAEKRNLNLFIQVEEKIKEVYSKIKPEEKMQIEDNNFVPRKIVMEKNITDQVRKIA